MLGISKIKERCAIIIAECGQNHMGYMGLAKRLIELAKQYGADLCKFQLYDSEKLYGEKQKSELSKEQAFMLFNYGNEIGIEVFFSVFDIERVKWCEEMGVKRYKIACKMREFSVWEAISKTKKPTLISSNGEEKFPIPLDARILYCIPKYPTLPTELNFQSEDLEVCGFSDHTIGIDCAKIALARGAQIIEKHFAVDHKTGVDAQWSMTPVELAGLKRFENLVKEALNSNR